MTTDELAGRLASSLSAGSRDLFSTLVLELSRGAPVSRRTVASIIGWSLDEVDAALTRTPSIELDDQGDIVGAGLTLRETPHAFEIDGKCLYTWCALDALIFPAVIGTVARVSSRCAATGAPIRLVVGPEGVRRVEPHDAVVSLVSPDDSPDVRRSFCAHVHFLVSGDVARAWLATRPGATILRIEDAFRLGQQLAGALFAKSHQPACAC